MLPFSPTARGWAMIFLCFASLGVSLSNINLAAGITAAGFFAVLGASFIMSLLSIRKIDVWRSPGSDCCAGEKIILPITVRNRGRITRQSFVIREKLPFSDSPLGSVAVEPLKPGETRLINREFNAVTRGNYSLERIYLIGGDPAGLFRRVRKFKFHEEITVYPEIFPVSWMPIFKKNKIQASTSGKPIGVSGLGEEFFGVREYRTSDSMRFIHWKATAKQKKLMVREFESHSSVTLCILLDTERRRTGLNPIVNNFEHLVKTAATITNYVCGMYCRIMFIAPDGRTGETVILNGTGAGLRREILDLLSMIQTSSTSLDQLMETAESAVPPNSILYCLTLSENQKLSDRFDFLMQRGVDIRWISAPMENFFAPYKISNKSIESYSRYTAVPPGVLDINSNIPRVLTYG
ncbi:MAG TPA: hypothetical protein DET40_21990 [Lentisphaeria bacterium]|nr:MAG: hypothetical protein A2X45_04080 [Lentisphaerae bacterium GWF2_50_93]HCE46225.1 hypothetical protein [Lentisphaeria bacterium]